MSYSPYNPDIESHFIACLMQFPEIYGEVSIVVEKDFSAIHRPIYSVIRQQLETNPPSPVTTVILSDKLKGYGVDSSKLLGVEPYDYMWALSAKPVKKEDAGGLMKELKLLTVRRELVEKCREAEAQLRETPSDKFDEMVGIVDRTLSSVNTEYYRGGENENIFIGMEEKIEEEGNNPPKDGVVDGYNGPFPAFNEVFGPIIYRGSMCLVGARSGAGKSSLSWFYTSHVAEKHEIPLLILDAAEMTPEEIQYRAICCLSQGKIPYWALQNREWRKNKEWTQLIRDDIWPRVRKMMKTGIYYQNIGGMSAKEIVTYVKRFYYNKVGRDRMLLINLDYIKGMESFNKNSSEFQAIGNYVMDLKTLITNEITASIWTSVQNNRSAIMVGKSGSDLATENDGQMGLSDRIIQQATHGFIMRYKTPEELAIEGNKFGNLKVVCVKHRRMGRKAFDFLTPVKTPNGKFATNYFNLETKGFAYWDRGTYKEMVEKLGQGVIQLDEVTGEKDYYYLMKLDVSRLVNVKKQADGSIQCQCPACASEGNDKSGKNHLRIYRTGAFNCVLYGKDKEHNGKIRAYLRHTNLEENPDIVYIDPEPTIKIEKVYPEDTLSKLLPDYSYWVNRGANPNILKELEGGLAPYDEKSKLAGRFIFPIRGRDGRINGFTGRLVEENSFAPTWKHLFKSSMACWPWNVNGKYIKESHKVVLVESVGDLLALMSHGIKNVICIFGLNLNGKIISTLIANNINKIYISLNRDDDPNKGQRAAEKIQNKLCAFYPEDRVIIRLPPPGIKDWGEANVDHIKAFKEEINK